MRGGQSYLHRHVKAPRLVAVSRVMPRDLSGRYFGDDVPPVIAGPGGGAAANIDGEQPVTAVPVTVVPDTTQTFWQAHGAEVLVGVLTAALGAVATYFAMKAVERRR